MLISREFVCLVSEFYGFVKDFVQCCIQVFKAGRQKLGLPVSIFENVKNYHEDINKVCMKADHASDMINERSYEVLLCLM